MSIRDKILISLLVAALVPLALVAAAVLPFHRGNLLDRESALLAASAQTRATRVEAAIRGGSSESLQQIADQLPSLGESSEVLIFARDASGRFVPAANPRFAAVGAYPDERMEALLAEAYGDPEGRQGTFADQRGVPSVLFAKRAGETDHVAIVKLDQAEILRQNVVLRDYFLILSFIVMALGGLLALLIARMVVGPLLVLTRTVETFHGASPERIEVIGNDEVSTLARKFREMWEPMASYNEELEKAIWKRTDELTKARAEQEKSDAVLGARLEEIEKLYAMLIGRDMTPEQLNEQIRKLRGGPQKDDEATS